VHTAESQSEFTLQFDLAGCAAAALTMHKWVAGWHTPEMQSEFTLHVAPTWPAVCASVVLLPLVIAPITQMAGMTIVTKSRRCRLAMPVDPILVCRP
jgi:hypothetical protein